MGAVAQDLPFRTRPSARLDLLPALLGYLSGRGWVTARHLRELFGSDRSIRLLAEASKGQIISGQRGYHLTCQASVADCLHASAWLRSQARRMTARALDIERAMHQRSVVVDSNKGSK